MFTHGIKAGTKKGEYGPIPVPKEKVLTAPPDARTLLVVADSKDVLDPPRDDEAYALEFSPDDLTTDQLNEIMPGAGTYVEPLNAAMGQFSISTLEQKAMFLGQLAHESSNLQTWSEKYNGNPDQYFINKYWVSKGQWTGLASSVPTTDGIALNIPHAKGPKTKTYQLYWAQGPKVTNSATLYGEMAFTYASGRYSAKFAGAVPPKDTTYLLVVDPANNKVVQAIRNKLGNWSPQDATNFRGRGPIQITGRYNYQKFADYAGVPDLMTNAAMLADKQNNPLLGMQSAGWFWDILNNHRLNEVTDSFAYKSSTAFNTAVTKVINGGTNGLAQRLTTYRRARSPLLTDPNAGQSLYADRVAAPALRGSFDALPSGADLLGDDSPAGSTWDNVAAAAVASSSGDGKVGASLSMPALSAASALHGIDQQSLSAARLDAMAFVYPEKPFAKRAQTAKSIRPPADSTDGPMWSNAAARTVDVAIAELSTTVL
jgi:predicted chitinase